MSTFHLHKHRPTNTEKTFWQLLTIFYVLSWLSGVADLFSYVLGQSPRQSLFRFTLTPAPIPMSIGGPLSGCASTWHFAYGAINQSISSLNSDHLIWDCLLAGPVSLGPEEPELSVVSLSLLPLSLQYIRFIPDPILLCDDSALAICKLWLDCDGAMAAFHMLVPWDEKIGW